MKCKHDNTDINKEAFHSEAHYFADITPLVNIYTPLRIGFNPFKC